jgi:chromosome segregation ATPase
MNDPTVSPLVAEIHRLQYELDAANESIDDKIDKLEEAGLGVVGLTQKLEDARSKVSALEDEIARLTRREERRNRVMERARCQKCQVRVDLDERFVDQHILLVVD